MPALVPAGAAVAAFFATPVGGLLLSAALSGASFLLQNALQSNTAQADQGVQQTVQNSIYPERAIYGRSLVGGRVFFCECKPPWYYLGVEIASHEIDGIDQVLINGNVATFAGTSNSPVTSTNYVNSTGTPYAYMSLRTGAAGQTIDPILAADFPELAASFREQGKATVVMKCLYGANADDHNKFWGYQFPQFLFQVRGLKVFDPNDATQSVSAPATWKWSDTASLCIAHYMTFARGMGRSWSQLDMASLKQAALDDKWGVAKADGTFEKRYAINGVVDLNTEPATILQSMLTANLGDVIWSNGLYRFSSGVAKTPVWTFTDASARGAMEVRGSRDRASLVNLVRTVFVSPDREYQTVNGPILSNGTYQAADGESHELTITLPFTTSQTCAQRIAKAIMERSRHGKTITRHESIEALKFDAADVVNIQCDTMPVLGGIYKLNVLTLNHETMEFNIEAEEYYAAMYDWTTAEEQPFTIAPAVLAGTN